MKGHRDGPGFVSSRVNRSPKQREAPAKGQRGAGAPSVPCQRRARGMLRERAATPGSECRARSHPGKSSVQSVHHAEQATEPASASNSGSKSKAAGHVASATQRWARCSRSARAPVPRKPRLGEGTGLGCPSGHSRPASPGCSHGWEVLGGVRMSPTGVTLAGTRSGAALGRGLGRRRRGRGLWLPGSFLHGPPRPPWPQSHPHSRSPAPLRPHPGFPRLSWTLATGGWLPSSDNPRSPRRPGGHRDNLTPWSWACR